MPTKKTTKKTIVTPEASTKPAVAETSAPSGRLTEAQFNALKVGSDLTISSGTKVGIVTAAYTKGGKFTIDIVDPRDENHQHAGLTYEAYVSGDEGVEMYKQLRALIALAQLQAMIEGSAQA